MLTLFPQLADVAIDHAWGGTLSVTVQRLPHVGRLQPNLFLTPRNARRAGPSA
jgi:gamma-glutamylputrescine oxidase